MNWIETVYCSQYYELKEKGRDPMKARLNGTLLTATMLLLAGVVLFKLGYKYIPWQLPADSNISGKAMGQVLGLAGLVIVGGIINFTIGSQKQYLKMIERWQQLPDDVLKATIKKSLRYFLIVFAAFLFAVLFL
ncbi:hypothetical protein [Ferruginibacter sp. SUN106]|uniref:hypothetical protein n=1 Tax=Ferruginibacter sp. SUN106 TaxID=2978348 RepID=UPI003D36E5C2